MLTPYFSELKIFLRKIKWFLKFSTYKIEHRSLFISYIKNKSGLEIGGPSPIFQAVIPIYKTLGSLDGVNFSANTLWEGPIDAGRTYNYFNKKTGHQFISDATSLRDIPSDSYDFLLSCNSLEHVANPLKALLEWKRVLKNEGAFVLVLPNKASNFDHKRPTTEFEHLLADFNNDIKEDDLTHLQEILDLHDLSRDKCAGNFSDFKTRCQDNFNNRTLHHHIFDEDLIRRVLAHANFNIICIDVKIDNFYVLATKCN